MEHSKAGIGEPGIRERKASVLLKRLFVVVDGRLYVLHILLAAHRAAAFQVQIVSLKILRVVRRRASGLLPGWLVSQRFDNPAINLILQREQILLHARKFLCPNAEAT